MGRLTFEYFTDYCESLEALFFLERHKVSKVLHHAHNVRVTCVLVLPIEEAFSKCFVVTHNVALVHSNLNVPIHVG